MVDELGDCADFDDSDVILENGFSTIGRVNSLMPRFEPDNEDCDS